MSSDNENIGLGHNAYFEQAAKSSFTSITVERTTGSETLIAYGDEAAEALFERVENDPTVSHFRHQTIDPSILDLDSINRDRLSWDSIGL